MKTDSCWPPVPSFQHVSTLNSLQVRVIRLHCRVCCAYGGADCWYQPCTAAYSITAARASVLIFRYRCWLIEPHLCGSGGGQVVFTIVSSPGVSFEFRIVSAELRWKQGICMSMLLTSTALLQDAKYAYRSPAFTAFTPCVLLMQI
jgi:hypothetical protein